MALSIKNPKANRLARELAELTGESQTEAVIRALRERFQRVHGGKRGADLVDEVRRIQERVSRLPVHDARSANESIGYDERGLPN